MRHKYATSALVLSRSPLSEASAYLSLLTSDFGLLRARVQSIRSSGAKLQSALQTLCAADIVLVKGKEEWRVMGAIGKENFARSLPYAARARVARVASLLQRLLHGESHDTDAYKIFTAFLVALPSLSLEEQDAAECLLALRILRLSGHDAGDIPGSLNAYDAETLQTVLRTRSALVARINHGIAASGL